MLIKSDLTFLNKKYLKDILEVLFLPNVSEETFINKSKDLPISWHQGHFYCFKSSGDNIIFPSGFAPPIYKILSVKYPDLEIENELKEKILNNFKVNPDFEIWDGISANTGEPVFKERDYQKEVITKCITKKRGIVKSATASGKTFMLAEIIRGFGIDLHNHLILVPTIDLLKQTKDNLESIYEHQGLKVKVGIIGNSNWKVEKITVATPVTLNNKLNKDLGKNFLDSIDCLYVDECHKFINKTGYKVIQACRNRAVSLMLSGTPEVNDGLTPLIKGLSGSRLVDINAVTLQEKGYLSKVKFIFHEAPKAKVSPKLLFSKVNKVTYGKLYTSIIVKNDKRNDLVVNILKDLLAIDSESEVIIIVGRIEHGQILSKKIKEKLNIDCPFYYGTLNKKYKENLMEELRNSKYRCFIGTQKTFTEGIDIPNLTDCIFVGVDKVENGSVQRIGRTLRVNKKKREEVTIHDFIDTQSCFEKQSETRMNIYIQNFGSENVIIKK